MTLELLRVRLGAQAAYELLLESGWELRAGDIYAGMILLCGATAASDWLYSTNLLGDYRERYDVIEARYFRDHIFVGDRRGRLVRAEWLDEKCGGTSLLADILVGSAPPSSSIRRTWSGLYYADHEWQQLPALPLKDLVLHALTTRASMYSRDLHRELLASGSRHAHVGSVAATLSTLQSAGKVACINHIWYAVPPA